MCCCTPVAGTRSSHFWSFRGGIGPGGEGPGPVTILDPFWVHFGLARLAINCLGWSSAQATPLRYGKNFICNYPRYPTI